MLTGILLDTARMQARYTDLMIFNKWELVNDSRYEDCLDRVGDLELQVATVKSNKGRVDSSVLLGLDSKLAEITDPLDHKHSDTEHGHQISNHQSEVEVLSIGLFASNPADAVDLESLETFLLSAPKDEIYRIKGLVSASRPPASSGGAVEPVQTHRGQNIARYILNWAFGRWTFTPLHGAAPHVHESDTRNPEITTIVHDPEELKIDPIARLTVILARGEANKWRKRIETQRHIEPENHAAKWRLDIQRRL